MENNVSQILIEVMLSLINGAFDLIRMIFMDLAYYLIKIGLYFIIQY